MTSPHNGYALLTSDEGSRRQGYEARLDQEDDELISEDSQEVEDAKISWYAT